MVVGIVFGECAQRPTALARCFVPDADNDPGARYRVVLAPRLGRHRNPRGDRLAGRLKATELESLFLHGGDFENPQFRAGTSSTRSSLPFYRLMLSYARFGISHSWRIWWRTISSVAFGYPDAPVR